MAFRRAERPSSSSILREDFGVLDRETTQLLDDRRQMSVHRSAGRQGIMCLESTKDLPMLGEGHDMPARGRKKAAHTVDIGA